MKTTDKLPYKVQFQPEYQTFQERMGKLPVPPVIPNTVIQPVQQLIDLVGLKQKIKDEELQFTPSTIYSQYASANLLKQGKKNMRQFCTGCGEENKKPIQCEFCGIMFCKNCCWRKRVIPNLSEPKQHRMECQDCHIKFVKLFVNQKFYDESAMFQKIIDSCSGRVKKLQKDVKAKKQRFEGGEKKKKQYKIKENVLLKQVKDQQKKLQALQLKLQEVVNKKAQRLKQAHQRQQRLEQQTKKQQQLNELLRRQQQNLKRQQQIEQNRRRQEQLQKEKQAIRKKEQQTRRQIERQQRQLQQQRRKQRQRIEQLKRLQQKKNQELKALSLKNQKQMVSDTEHKKQADELRDLAKNMMKQPEHLNEKPILNAPEVIVTTYEVENVENPFKTPKQPEQIMFTAVNTLNSPTLTNKKSNASPTYGHQQKDNDLKSNSKSTSNSVNQNQVAANNEKKELKTSLTQSTQKAAQNHIQLLNSLKSEEKIKQQKGGFKTPDISIDVTAMTVNQLLGIHVDPYGNQNRKTNNKRTSQRQSYPEEKRTSYIQDSPQVTPVTIQTRKNELQLTEQQKMQILRSSNVSASLLHSAHTEQEAQAHSDQIGGSKCNCTLM